MTSLSLSQYASMTYCYSARATSWYFAAVATLKQDVGINDLGDPKKIIGIEIYCDRATRTIQISQEHYIDPATQHASGCHISRGRHRRHSCARCGSGSGIAFK
jgi:hypothetical protein